MCVLCLGQNTLSLSSRYGALLKNYLNVLKIPDIGVNSLLKGVGWMSVGNYRVRI